MLCRQAHLVAVVLLAGAKGHRLIHAAPGVQRATLPLVHQRGLRGSTAGLVWGAGALRPASGWPYGQRLVSLALKHSSHHLPLLAHL